MSHCRLILCALSPLQKDVCLICPAVFLERCCCDTVVTISVCTFQHWELLTSKPHARLILMQASSVYWRSQKQSWWLCCCFVISSNFEPCSFLSSWSLIRYSMSIRHTIILIALYGSSVCSYLKEHLLWGKVVITAFLSDAGVKSWLCRWGCELGPLCNLCGGMREVIVRSSHGCNSTRLCLWCVLLLKYSHYPLLQKTHMKTNWACCSAG